MFGKDLNHKWAIRLTLNYLLIYFLLISCIFFFLIFHSLKYFLVLWKLSDSFGGSKGIITDEKSNITCLIKIEFSSKKNSEKESLSKTFNKLNEYFAFSTSKIISSPSNEKSQYLGKANKGLNFTNNKQFGENTSSNLSLEDCDDSISYEDTVFQSINLDKNLKTLT